MTTENHNTPAKKTACKICLEQINFGAKKCVHCGSFQHLPIVFNISPIVLSLLVGLIGILTAGVPILKKSFDSQRSEVVSIPYEITRNYFKFTLANLGNKSAILVGAKLYTVEKERDKPHDLNMKIENKDTILEPNEKKIIKLNFVLRGTDTELTEVSSSNAPCQYAVRFDIKGFDHTPEEIRSVVDCPE